jgi:hypothetical protein
VEFRHKDQLIGFVATKDVVVINETPCVALTNFNVYERANVYNSELEANGKPYFDRLGFVDWLVNERTVVLEDPKKKDPKVKVKPRRYRNYPLHPDPKRVFWIVGMLIKNFGEEILKEMSTMDIYILAVVTEENEPLLEYGWGPLGSLNFSNQIYIKARIRRCGILLRELEKEWRQPNAAINKDQGLTSK